MEVLYDIFKIMLCITGILFMLMIILSIIITPFVERKRKKELHKLAEECLKEITNEEKTIKKATRKTRKKDEN